MFQRKLLALGYQGAKNFDLNDERCLREFVVWLEDQKIRHYTIDDRAALRKIESDDWPNALKKYMTEVNCPYSIDDRAAFIDWFLGFAVRLEYADNLEVYESFDPEKFKEQCSIKCSSSNPLDNLDFESAEFKSGVVKLASMLQVPPHSDHKQVAKAICILIRDRLCKQAIDNAGKSESKREFIPMEQTELGFDAGDYISNDVAKILRLLYIKDLRDLQTQINRAIVCVQTLTADPKTDQRLGKVGR